MDANNKEGKQIFLLVPQEDVEDIRNTLKDIQVQLSNQRNSPKVLGDYISEKDAQEMLNRKTTWFWQKRKSGQLKGKKAGNHWYYKEDDIIRFIKNGMPSFKQ
jgi:phosphoribosyl-AMP cyclohydrolase